MQIEQAWVHGAICTVMLLLCYLLLTSRRLWYLAVALFLLNMGLVAVYLAVNAMTGAGFNEAALYYLLQASWRDVGLLFAYDGVRHGLPALVGGVLLCTWLARKLRLPGLLQLSRVPQATLVVGTAALGLYMTPLVLDVGYTVQAAGLDKRDHIGLQAVAERNDAVQTVAGPHKNLIVLYAESLEAAFFDEQLFPGLMPRLNRLATQGLRFDRIEQSPMSDWTMAGMIATQCGVPLSSHRMLNDPNDFGKFSTGYQCLSHHLARQGHARVYMGGASNGFAGKGDYYRSMGFDEVLGLEQLATPASPQSQWGLYDDELLPLVQGKIRALRGDGKRPFALLALTLDTHPPAGFASPTCAARGIRSSQVAGKHFDTLRCTDEILADFLEQVIRENIHDSTIVLLSDHVMMNSQALQTLDTKRAPRLNHMVIWDKGQEPGVVHRRASQFDVAPTVLQVLLGKSYQVGFGFSMLDSRPNLTEQYGREVFDESVYAWRTESWKKW